MDRNIAVFEESSDSFDVEPHHRPTHVIGVIVGCEYTRHGHAVGSGDVDEFIHCVGGIDDEALLRDSISDQIDEVHHLRGDGIPGGEVHSGEKLTEVEPIVHRARIGGLGRDSNRASGPLVTLARWMARLLLSRVHSPV